MGKTITFTENEFLTTFYLFFCHFSCNDLSKQNLKLLHIMNLSKINISHECEGFSTNFERIIEL